MGWDKAVSSSSSNSMGEAITTLEGCARLFSQRGTGGGMQAVDTNALSRDTPFHRLASEGYKTKTRGHSHAKQQLASEGCKPKTRGLSHAKQQLASAGSKQKTRGHSHAKHHCKQKTRMHSHAKHHCKHKTRGHSRAKHQLACGVGCSVWRPVVV